MNSTTDVGERRIFAQTSTGRLTYQKGSQNSRPDLPSSTSTLVSYEVTLRVSKVCISQLCVIPNLHFAAQFHSFAAQMILTWWYLSQGR